MRCLYCGKRLSLLRKISSSGFCTQAHQRSYQEEQESLGLARLIESNPRTAPPLRTEAVKRKESPPPAAPPPPAKHVPQTPQAVSALKRDFTAPAPLAIPSLFAHPLSDIGPKPPMMPGATWRFWEVTPPPFQDLPRPPDRAPANPSWHEIPLADLHPERLFARARLLFAQNVELPIRPIEITPLPAGRPEHRHFRPITKWPGFPIRFSARLVEFRRLPLDIPLADKPFTGTWTALDPRFLFADIHLPQYRPALESGIPPEAAPAEPVHAGFLLRQSPIGPRDAPKSIAEPKSEPSGAFPEHQPVFAEPALPWAALTAVDPPGCYTARALAAAAAPQPIRSLCPVACPTEMSEDRLHLAVSLRFREVSTARLDGSQPGRLETLPPPISWNPAIVYRQATRFRSARLRLDTGLFPPPAARQLDCAKPNSLAFRPEPVIPSGSPRYTPGGLPAKLHSAFSPAGSLGLALMPHAEGPKPLPALRQALHAQTPLLRTLVPAAAPVLCSLPAIAGRIVMAAPFEILEGARPAASFAPCPRDPGAILAPWGVALSPDISFETPTAVFADLAPATYAALVPLDAKPAWKALLSPLPLVPKRMLPRANLVVASATAVAVAATVSVPLWKKAWIPVVNAGRTHPRSARWIAAAIPLAVVLALVPGTDASRSEKRFAHGLSTRWQSIQSGIANRAAISFRDDFRSGLADWTGSGNWNTSWSFDRGGFVRPGKLALYKPSLPLSDYRFEFSVFVEQKGVGWAFRAKDTRNYHAVKLMVEPGDSPTAALIRYPVTNGKAGQRTRTPLPLLSRRSMQDILVDVRGAEFALYVDNRLVDHWTEREPVRGGIGFFADSGERARVAWVAVTHQYDIIGRLCSWIAPYGSDKR